MVEARLPREFDECYIYPIGDIHLGDPANNLDKLHRYLDWILSVPNAYIILNGDLANVATRSSVSDVYGEQFPVQEQLERLVKIFTPVKDRVLCLTGGNHEERLSKEVGFDLTRWLAISLGIVDRYRPGEVYLKVAVGEYRQHQKSSAAQVVYTIYVTHGWAGGRRASATSNQLEELSRITDCDLFIVGHTHKKMTFAGGYHRPDVRSNKVIAVKRLFVSTGAYLNRTPESYATKKGYAPTWPGSPRIRLDGRRKDAHASV